MGTQLPEGFELVDAPVQAGGLPEGFELMEPAVQSEQRDEEEIGFFEGLGNALGRGTNRVTSSFEYATGDLAGIAKDQRDMDLYPTPKRVTEGLQEINEAETFLGAVASVFSNPEAALTVVAESLPQVPGALGSGLVGGVAGTAVGSVPGALIGTALGVGSYSGASEYINTVMETITEAGYDPRKEEDLAIAFADAEVMAEARDRGLKRGIAIGTIDAVSAGIGGKVSPLFKSKLAGEAAEIGSQATFGGAGEATAQLWTDGEVKMGEVVLEGIAEIPTGVVETAVSRINQSNAQKKADAENLKSKIKNQARREIDEISLGLPDTDLEQEAQRITALGKLNEQTALMDEMAGNIEQFQQETIKNQQMNDAWAQQEAEVKSQKDDLDAMTRKELLDHMVALSTSGDMTAERAAVIDDIRAELNTRRPEIRKAMDSIESRKLDQDLIAALKRQKQIDERAEAQQRISNATAPVPNSQLRDNLSQSLLQKAVDDKANEFANTRGLPSPEQVQPAIGSDDMQSQREAIVDQRRQDQLGLTEVANTKTGTANGENNLSEQAQNLKSEYVSKVDTLPTANSETEFSEEKRTQPGLRQVIEDMEPAEKDAVIAQLREENQRIQDRLYTSEITGVPNRAKYTDSDKKAYTASIDVDSLKFINDSLGHENGDKLLKAVATALNKAGVEVYHVSGDEFIAQGDDAAVLKQQLDSAYEYLNDLGIEGTTKDGKKLRATKGGFSYGIGQDMATAETDMHTNKADREAKGLRAARGEMPPGVSEIQETQSRRAVMDLVDTNKSLLRGTKFESTDLDHVATTYGIAKKKKGETVKQRRVRLLSYGKKIEALQGQTVESLVAGNSKEQLGTLAKQLEIKPTGNKKQVAGKILGKIDQVEKGYTDMLLTRENVERLNRMTSDSKPVPLKMLSSNPTLSKLKGVYSLGDVFVARAMGMDEVPPTANRGKDAAVFEQVEQFMLEPTKFTDERGLWKTEAGKVLLDRFNRISNSDAAGSMVSTEFKAALSEMGLPDNLGMTLAQQLYVDLSSKKRIDPANYAPAKQEAADRQAEFEAYSALSPEQKVESQLKELGDYDVATTSKRDWALENKIKNGLQAVARDTEAGTPLAKNITEAADRLGADSSWWFKEAPKPAVKSSYTETMDRIESRERWNDFEQDFEQLSNMEGRGEKRFFVDQAKALSEQLVKGGNITYLSDDNDKIVGRTSSENPQWFKDMRDDFPSITTQYVKDTVSKLEGKGYDSLTPKQKRVADYLFDEVVSEALMNGATVDEISSQLDNYESLVADEQSSNTDRQTTDAAADGKAVSEVRSGSEPAADSESVSEVSPEATGTPNTSRDRVESEKTQRQLDDSFDQEEAGLYDDDIPDIGSGIRYDGDDIPFSKGEDTDGVSVEQAELELRQDPALKKAVDSGKVKVVQNPGDLILEVEKVNPKASQLTLFSRGGAVQGAYVNGTAYVVADNNASGTVQNVARHELFHAALAGLSEKVRNDLLKRGETLLVMAKGKGDVANWVRDAEKRIPADTVESNRAEELLAYAVTNHQKAPKSIRQWVRDLITTIKAAVYRNTGVLFGSLKPADLAALADAYAKRGEQVVTVDDVKASIASDDPVVNQRTGDAPEYQTDDSTGFMVPDDRFTKRMIRKLQDKMQVLKDVQKEIELAGGNINDENNAYIAEELYYGKAERDLDALKDRYVKPMADMLAKSKISQAELDEYLYARHAKERNAHIAEINPAMPEGGSGMTDAEADAILAKVKRSGKQSNFDKLADNTYAMLKDMRDLMNTHGLEDNDVTGAWEAKYENYVPLKGWAEDTKEQGIPGEEHLMTGSGFAIRGNESQRAKGRSSKAASPSTYAITDMTRTIVRARKNEVGNTFLKMIEDNPNPDYWEVFTDENPDTDRQIVKVKDPVTGGAKEEVRTQPVPMAMMARGQNSPYFTTKRDGKTYYMKLKDPRLMTAMKNMGVAQANSVIRALGMVSRWMSALNTSLNPEFMLTNFSRDVQTALLNLKAEQTRDDGKIRGESITRQTAKDIPIAMKAIYQALRGDMKESGKTAEWQTYFDEFKADGAKTGYFDMKDLEQQQKEVEKLVGIAEGGFKGGTKTAIHDTFEVIEDINTSVENAVRLSAYVNARRAGVSRVKAASLAKNMTVNFNRKGELGTTMNALYMFANASVQGTANFVRTLGSLNGDGKLKWGNLNTAQKIALGIVGGTYMLAAANRFAAGDDDDGENYYDKVEDYVKERNIVIMKSLVGGPEGEYWKIPMPYGYNVFGVLGQSIEAMMNGNEDPMRVTTSMILAAAGSFSPIGFQDSDSLEGLFLKNAAPTIIKPIVEVGLNENFMGNSIYNENLPFGVQKPDSSLSRNSTPDAYRVFAETANKVTGGSEYRSGWFDVNPDVLNYIVDYFGGSSTAFFTSKVPDYVYRKVGGAEVDPQRVPFAGRFEGKVLPYGDFSDYYERRGEIQQLAKEFPTLKGQDRVEFREQFGDKLKLNGMFKPIDKQLKYLRKRRDAIYEQDLPIGERDRKLRDIQQKMDEIVGRFNKRYNEIED